MERKRWLSPSLWRRKTGTVTFSAGSPFFNRELISAEKVTVPMAWISLCELTELKPGEGKYVEIDGFQLAVFIDHEKVFVIDNTCPHAGGNLAGGYVDDGCAICPWHYWAFRLDSGELKESPAIKISTYKTRIFDHEGKKLVQADLPTL